MGIMPIWRVIDPISVHVNACGMPFGLIAFHQSFLLFLHLEERLLTLALLGSLELLPLVPVSGSVHLHLQTSLLRLVWFFGLTLGSFHSIVVPGDSMQVLCLLEWSFLGAHIGCESL